jgi:hypothetical protein
MHYEVEVRTTAGENRGCAARTVRVAGDGAREVVEARISGRATARVRSGGGPSCAPIRRSLVAHRRSLR